MEERKQFGTADLVVFIGKSLVATVTFCAIMRYLYVIVSKMIWKKVKNNKLLHNLLNIKSVWLQNFTKQFLNSEKETLTLLVKLNKT